VFKSGRKSISYIIFKAKPTPTGRKFGNKNSVAYEIYHDLPDCWGNKYPSTQDYVIAVSETANSSGDRTLDIIDRVFFPELDIDKDGKANHLFVMWMDDFRGHIDRKVKERTFPLKGTFKWEIMAGGITPHPVIGCHDQQDPEGILLCYF